ncbi:MAG: 3-deoxy-manno-octulosonate cytidylyltransferase [Planctomycetota bacterium]|nr:MAG: 3-deoxy-manno-octulosonate cytidylyltransferase [Planctomycetota bacterium]
MPRGPSAVAIIPARLGSTRFPAKVLKSETGKPLIVHVCERAAAAPSVSRVVVATDAPEVADAVRAHGFEPVMTSPDHPNGTSRLAETATLLRLRRDQAVVNVQGDEPEIDPEIIEGAIAAIHDAQQSKGAAHGWGNPVWTTDSHLRGVGTVASVIRSEEEFLNPNVVKVVTGAITPDIGVAPAIYFSRAPIPHDRDRSGAAVRLRHVGIYAYPVHVLLRYPQLPPTPLERSESLEQLRWLEHGCPVHVAIRDSSHAGIDTPDQYAAFVERYRAASSG